MSAPKGGNRLQKKSSGQKHWTLILFMVPGLVYLLINNYIPMAGILLAFKKVNYTLGIFKSPWCGLSNFKYLFKTKDAAIIFRIWPSSFWVLPRLWPRPYCLVR